MLSGDCHINNNAAYYGGGMAIYGKEITKISGAPDISANTATITSSANFVETPTSLEFRIQDPYGLDVFVKNGDLLPVNISAGFKISEQEFIITARLKSDSGNYYQLQEEDYCLI